MLLLKAFITYILYISNYNVFADTIPFNLHLSNKYEVLSRDTNNETQRRYLRRLSPPLPVRPKPPVPAKPPPVPAKTKPPPHSSSKPAKTTTKIVKDEVVAPPSRNGPSNAETRYGSSVGDKL